MTNSSLPIPASSTSSRIRLPGTATALFILSPLLLFVGVMTAFSTVGFDYFERALNQTVLGTVMIVVGIAFLLTAFVLVGIRSVAQQQLDILLQAERGPAQQRDGE